MLGRLPRKNVMYIFRLNNALTKVRNKKLLKYELTSIQADVLMYILAHAPGREINQLDIQSVFKLTNPTVSGIIDRLEEKGFVKRARSLKDARFRRLLPTEKGEPLLDILLDSAESTEEEILSELSDEEKKEFERLLMITLKTAEKN